MTDLPTTAVLPVVPTRRLPVVRPPACPARGRWGAVIIVAVVDWALAMLLLLGALFPDPGDRGSATRSPVPPPVAPLPTGGGVPVAVDARSLGRQGDGRDGGDSSSGSSTSTTGVRPVVPDAAPARGQTPQGPAGGPASTVTSVAPTLPPEPPPSTVPPVVPEIPSTTVGEPPGPPKTTEETTP